MEKTKKGYLCGIDFQHELCDDNANGVELFGSKEALKSNKSCWKECGILEVEIKPIKWIEPQEI